MTLQQQILARLAEGPRDVADLAIELNHPLPAMDRAVEDMAACNLVVVDGETVSLPPGDEPAPTTVGDTDHRRDELVRALELDPGSYSWDELIEMVRRWMPAPMTADERTELRAACRRLAELEECRARLARAAGVHPDRPDDVVVDEVHALRELRDDLRELLGVSGYVDLRQRVTAVAQEAEEADMWHGVMARALGVVGSPLDYAWKDLADRARELVDRVAAMGRHAGSADRWRRAVALALGIAGPPLDYAWEDLVERVRTAVTNELTQDEQDLLDEGNEVFCYMMDHDLLDQGGLTIVQGVRRLHWMQAESDMVAREALAEAEALRGEKERLYDGVKRLRAQLRDLEAGRAREVVASSTIDPVRYAVAAIMGADPEDGPAILETLGELLRALGEAEGEARALRGGA